MKSFHVGIKGVVRNKNGQVLLLQKNNDKGFWEVPGGRIDDDEDIETTLRRELEEELPGITNVQVGELLCAHRLPHDIGDNLGLMLLYFEVTADLPDPIQISDEHVATRWVSSVDEIELDGGTLKAVTEIFNS